MDGEFPVTVRCECEGFFSEGAKSASVSILGSLVEQDFETHEGGFFVHIKCTEIMPEAEVEVPALLNSLLAAHEHLWRVENCRVQELGEPDPPYTKVLVLLFRMVDMHEALSFF